jgi:hypothetical protein
MVYFNTKNSNVDILSRALEWLMLVYFMAIILGQSGNCVIINFVYFSPFWYIVQRKSGNPGYNHQHSRISSSLRYLSQSCSGFRVRSVLVWEMSSERRVARWFIFKPKSQFWVNFGWYWNGKCLSILCPFILFYGHLVCLFYGHLVYFGFVLYIFLPIWYVVQSKIWQH